MSVDDWDGLPPIAERLNEFEHLLAGGVWAAAAATRIPGLPDDVAGEAERLWAEHPREALGLLYRALLSRLLHDFRLPLKGSHTEGEVLRLVEGLHNDELSRFSQALTRHWQNLAYGHRLPPENLKRGICEAWRRLFAQERRA